VSIEQHLDRIATALEQLAAQGAARAVRELTTAPPPVEPASTATAKPITPLARLLAALAKAERPEQCASLWVRARGQLAPAEVPAGFAVAAAQVNALGSREDGDAWLRAQVAAAAKASPTSKASAPTTAAPRTTGRAR
jgi:hypothetical protein